MKNDKTVVYEESGEMWVEATCFNIPEFTWRDWGKWWNSL